MSKSKDHKTAEKSPLKPNKSTKVKKIENNNKSTSTKKEFVLNKPIIYNKSSSSISNRKIISLAKTKPTNNCDYEEEVKELENEIDKKTVEYIFKLKDNNPQINPEIFDKATEYIRIGASK